MTVNFCLVIIGHKTQNKNNINEEYFTDAIFIGEKRKKNLEIIMKYMVLQWRKNCNTLILPIIIII